MSQILQLGSKGPAVAELQAKLNLLQYGPINIDQEFGEPTRAALMSFQTTEGLPPTGQLDPLTESRLNQRVLMVSTGAREGATVQQAPLAPPTSPSRPLWQTGLMVLGGMAVAGGLLYFLFNDGPDAKGYRRVLPHGHQPKEIEGRYNSSGTRVAGADDVGSHRTKKCPQTPPADAFEQGQEIS